MKKILTLACVLVSTVMFANGTDDKNASSASGAAVIKNGESTFKVIYKSESKTDVKVSIMNDKNEVVYSEKVNKTTGFSRPYNFATLSEGDYTFAIESAVGKQLEKVSYKPARTAKALNVIKLKSQEGKFLVTAAGNGSEFVTVNIYDGDHTLIHTSTQLTEDNFAKLFDLNSVKGHLTFEITSENGETKTVAY